MSGRRGRRGVLLLLVASGWLGCGGPVAAREPVVGLPCEGCEAIFEGLPAAIGAVALLAPPDEPGERMLLTGRVLGADGEPRPGIVVYAYHTDARGHYPPAAAPSGPAAGRHGRLRGWAKSDAEGRYTFDTIRPAAYPGTSIPQHVHLHVLEPGCATYYVDDVLFRDDPLLTAEEIRRARQGRGGDGVVEPRREGGVWRVERDIQLGRNVPGYPECGSGGR